ncbi:typhoid-like toxin S-CDT ADP-ribosylating subunit PltA, partial [Salmonella enterica]
LVYDSATGLVKDGVSTMNSSYLGLSTTSNPGVIPFLPEPQTYTQQRIDAFGPLISSCFSIGSVCQSHRGQRADVYNMSFYDARPVIELILSK